MMQFIFACLKNKQTFLILLSGALVLMIAACTGGPRPSYNMKRGEIDAQTDQGGLINTRYLLGPLDTLRITFFLKPEITKEDYRLQAGDVLLLEIHRYEQLNRNLVVRPDGKITIPFAGEIIAAGRTNQDLSTEILNRLNKRYKSTEITLSVIRFNSYYRQIQEALGNTSGTRQRIDLVVDMNGSLQIPLCPRLEVAGRSTEWLENEVAQHYIKIGSNVGVNIDIMEAKSYLAYVLGEVNQPGPIEMRSSITVTQAIAMAGGFKETAGLSSVVMVRPNDKFQPVAQLFDITAVLGKGDISQDAIVQRYDVIYVPPSRIVSLNRSVLYGIRNMIPLQTNLGFSYIWGDQTSFRPF